MTCHCFSLYRGQEKGIIMRICVCDDEQRIRKMISEVCEVFFLKQGIAYQLEEAGNAIDVIDMADQIDLLILDIEMPGMNGVSLKNILQRRAERLLILFVTSHDEMMPEAFGRNVIGFCVKEQIGQRLQKYLKLAVSLMERDKLIDGKYHSQDVLLIHSEREYCSLCRENGADVLIRSSLTRMKRELEPVGFAQSNRAWLVNLRYVESLGKGDVRVAGRKVPLSRSFAKDFKQKYEEYCKKNARY